MGTRGMSRPMQRPPGEHSDRHSGGGHGEPYDEMRREMLVGHHRRVLWIPWTLILLGVWLLLAPFSFGYLQESAWVDPSGGRGVWFGDETHTALRAWLSVWNDVVCGVLLVVLGWRMLTPDRPVSGWLACGVGCWLNAAPVFLWAPTAAAYGNDTLVGMLVIALTILVPGMPNMVLFMRMGGSLPPGWSYNPSSWAQRWIMIVMGFVGLLVSRQLAMFQLGYVDRIWEPFFGDGTRQVLNSGMSHSLPVSDAALGALAYTFEFLMGYMGSPARWRTMPWMVAFFGILVIPLGLVHIFLVISQPVVVGHWCTLCLLAAAIMLPMIPLEADEVVAMAQHMKRSMRRGESMWRVFWKGGDPEGSGEDERSPALHTLPQRPWPVVKASVWGMSMPWTLAIAALLGAVAMGVPGMFGTGKPASTVFHLGGALVVVVSVVAMGEVLRAVRWLGVLLGLAIAALPWLVDGAGTAAGLLGLVLGLGAAALCVPRGIVRERYAGWDRLIV